MFALFFGLTLWTIYPFSKVCLCIIGHSKQITLKGLTVQILVLFHVYCVVVEFVRRANAVQTHTVYTGQNFTSSVCSSEMVHKTQVFMGERRMLTSNSQQFLMFEKHGSRKIIEGKLNSGPLIIFSYFFPAVFTALNTRASEIRTNLCLPDVLSGCWSKPRVSPVTKFVGSFHGTSSQSVAKKW